MTKKFILNPLDSYTRIRKLIVDCFKFDFVRMSMGRISGVKTNEILYSNSLISLTFFSTCQFWKLFDNKSKFNLEKAVTFISNSELTSWFFENKALINDDIKKLGLWRHNIVHLLDTSSVIWSFDRLFNDIIKQKIQPFLFMFLWQAYCKVYDVNLNNSDDYILEITSELNEFIKTLANEENKIIQK